MLLQHLQRGHVREVSVGELVDEVFVVGDGQQVAVLDVVPDADGQNCDALATSCSRCLQTGK